MNMRTKGILVYLAIAFGGAWGIWAILWIAGVSGTDPTFQWLSLPAAFAPALGGFVVRRWVTQEGFADVGNQLNLRTHWRYYLFAWFSPLIVTAVIVMLAMLFGISQPNFSLQRFLHTYAPSASVPPLPDPIFWMAIPATVIQALPVALLTWGEEFGWRGYLQIRLFANHPLRAAIATGLIWGIWHAPIILLGFQRYDNPWLGVLIFPVFTLWSSIILGWLRLKTGSLWSACLAHGATNAIGGSLTTLLFLGGPNWIFVNYGGILAWIPFGVMCGWIILGDRLNLKPIHPQQK
jgi:uncharacterized protein